MIGGLGDWRIGGLGDWGIGAAKSGKIEFVEVAIPKSTRCRFGD